MRDEDRTIEDWWAAEPEPRVGWKATGWGLVLVLPLWALIVAVTVVTVRGLS